MADQYYEDPRHWTAERYEAGDERRRIAVVASMIPGSAQSLLDVGCGNGAFLKELEERTSLRLAGVEPSASARAAAVCSSPVHAAAGDKLPVEDRSFDVVTALEVLEHLPHGTYERVLAELDRVALRSIVVSVPYREHANLTRCPACGCRFHPHYHMRTFDEDVMARLFPRRRLARLEIVARDDYLGGNLMRALYRRVAPGGPFLPTSICPQCGLKGDEVTRESPALRTKNTLAAAFKHRLPRVDRPWWMVALYGE